MLDNVEVLACSVREGDGYSYIFFFGVVDAIYISGVVYSFGKGFKSGVLRSCDGYDMLPNVDRVIGKIVVGDIRIYIITAKGLYLEIV